MKLNHDIGKLNETVSIIKENSFHFKKKFGQNFLVDCNILNKIVEESGVVNKDLVIEIGPGIGALSEKIADKCKDLILIEIDDTLIPILENGVGKRNNVEIIHNDVLKVDFFELIKSKVFDKVRVIANLPYYITTPIIMKLLENHYPIDSITVMVQKEVADRLVAKVGNKDYGAITLAVEYFTNARKAIQVSPNSFIPKPKVYSTVVDMKLKPNHECESFEKMLFSFIRAAFNQRRKTLVNAIGNANLDFINKQKLTEILGELGIDENIRGEKLTLQEYKDIINRC